MRTLGVDYGTVRIGLALSDETGLIAQPLTVVQRSSDRAAVRDIAAITSDRQVQRIVVGLPRHLSGELGERAKQCEAFAQRLRMATHLPVDMFDERLTTVIAERMLIAADVSRRKRRQVVDAAAAAVLLQTYLDARRAAPE